MFALLEKNPNSAIHFSERSNAQHGFMTTSVADSGRIDGGAAKPLQNVYTAQSLRIYALKLTNCHRFQECFDLELAPRAVLNSTHLRPRQELEVLNRERSPHFQEHINQEGICITLLLEDRMRAHLCVH